MFVLNSPDDLRIFNESFITNSDMILQTANELSTNISKTVKYKIENCSIIYIIFFIQVQFFMK